MKDSNSAVVSVKVPKHVKTKMRTLNVKWGEVLRNAIEQEIKEQEKKAALSDLLEFVSKNELPKNRTAETSEVLTRESREER
jgi:hypothetical protein